MRFNGRELIYQHQRDRFKLYSRNQFDKKYMGDASYTLEIKVLRDHLKRTWFITKRRTLTKSLNELTCKIAMLDFILFDK